MSGIMLLMDFENFCEQSAMIWSIVGWLLTIFKVVIPILLIVLGSIDFGKAVVAQDDGEIKKSTKSLAMRAVAAVIIFILPSVIIMVINWATEIAGTEMEFETCTDCVIHPSRCDTSGTNQS